MYHAQHSCEVRTSLQIVYQCITSTLNFNSHVHDGINVLECSGSRDVTNAVNRNGIGRLPDCIHFPCGEKLVVGCRFVTSIQYGNCAPETAALRNLHQYMQGSN